jgi:hypothetical protein
VAAATVADPAAAEQIRDRFLAARRGDLRQLLQRGVDRAELSPGRADLALDLVYGSMWYRLIFRTGPLDYAWAEAVADEIAVRP